MSFIGRRDKGDGRITGVNLAELNFEGEFRRQERQRDIGRITGLDPAKPYFEGESKGRAESPDFTRPDPTLKVSHEGEFCW